VGVAVLVGRLVGVGVGVKVGVSGVGMSVGVGVGVSGVGVPVDVGVLVGVSVTGVSVGGGGVGVSVEAAVVGVTTVGVEVSSVSVAVGDCVVERGGAGDWVSVARVVEGVVFRLGSAAARVEVGLLPSVSKGNRRLESRPISTTAATTAPIQAQRGRRRTTPPRKPSSYLGHDVQFPSKQTLAW
jgi:hypothetical protein